MQKARLSDCENGRLATSPGLTIDIEDAAERCMKIQRRKTLATLGLATLVVPVH